MKKLLSLAFAATVAFSVLAQEAEKADKVQPVREDRSPDSGVWPAFFAICEYPTAADVVGLRVTIPYSTRQENVTGVDLGFWGRSLYFEGIQLNLIRNDVRDGMAGFQLGVYNSIGRGEMLGVQVGLWNEAGCVRGAQAGLINVAGEAQGLQLGLVNRAETMYGYQVGLVNVIRDAELQFCPIVNVGF